MKRLVCGILLFSVLFTGCTKMNIQPPAEQKQFNATFLTLFDTVTTIVGRADSEAEFTQKSQAVHDDLLVYHQLFDIYNEYDGMNNLKTVNDAAGKAPIKVDRAIIDLLLDC